MCPHRTDANETVRAADLLPDAGPQIPRCPSLSQLERVFSLNESTTFVIAPETSVVFLTMA